MTVADKVNANPCQVRISSRDFLSAHRMVEPDLGAKHKVPKTRYEIMGVDNLRPGGADTHECEILLLREMRSTATRWPRQVRPEWFHRSGLLPGRPLQEEADTEMRYRVYNETDLPIREVRRLISFAGADLDFVRGRIWVWLRWTKPQKKSKPYAATGEAFWPVETVLHIARPEVYPAGWYDRSYTGHKLGMIECWQEALVAVAAHELKHLAEIQRGCDARHRLMEGRCDAYAFSRLDAYRRTQETFA